MGLLTRIGVPIALGVAVLSVLFFFRNQIGDIALKGGQVIGKFAAQPISGIISGFSEVASQFPDIEFKLPGIKITQGTFEILPQAEATQPGMIKPDQTIIPGLIPGSDVTIPSGCKVNPDGTVSCPTPPTITQQSGGLTPFKQEFLITDPNTFKLKKVSFEELQKFSPEGVAGLIDLLSTPTVEFLPVSAQKLATLENVQLSGQVFKELPSIGSILGNEGLFNA